MPSDMPVDKALQGKQSWEASLENPLYDQDQAGQ